MDWKELTRLGCCLGSSYEKICLLTPSFLCFCLSEGLDIESSLKQLAERRTDIFGVEETAIGKKIGEEEIQKPEEKVKWKACFKFSCCSEFSAVGSLHSLVCSCCKTEILIYLAVWYIFCFLSNPTQVTWDGHSGSMARTQQAAQANITLQEQIEAIHKAKGLVPEDDSKEKIGPSKPNEMPQPPPLSSASNPPVNAQPITSVPRPPSVSSLISRDAHGCDTS